uniref:DEAD/DEAH box helicase n=1 Tax=Candidatus Methanomethylicus mesodigestus TaxID=1867258 RepID=A0A7C3J4R9_9CREN
MSSAPIGWDQRYKRCAHPGEPQIYPQQDIYCDAEKGGSNLKSAPKKEWEAYISFLRGSEFSVQLLASNLAPSEEIRAPERIRVERLEYSLYPFQQKILDKIGDGTLVVGLPTGLGKTYLAGAYLKRETEARPERVLFLTPSVPLGVQQVLFARKKLGISNAHFISGSMAPEKRRTLKVWNSAFAVTTPQTFYNDILSPFASAIARAKETADPVGYLSSVYRGANFAFPYSILIADECHGYIGETDGYSILISAKACGCRILALSATPQLHAPKRLGELKKVFEKVEAISLEEPEIKAQMPERLIAIVRLVADAGLLSIYRVLSDVIAAYQSKVSRIYGSAHARGYCKRHPICICLIALKIMKTRIVEDGASSIIDYGIWKTRELNSPLNDLGGMSVREAYDALLRKESNHKIAAAKRILASGSFKKAIVFVESVEAAKQLGISLQRERGMGDVAVLVGKGDMAMEEQGSALLQFRERASILICTSIGEEGLDIPSADIEIWMDPPSNPKKWIQRFGRILRQSEGKRRAKTYALITVQTHERNKLLRTKAKVEKIYGFTQSVVEEDLPRPLPKNQKTLALFY